MSEIDVGTRSFLMLSLGKYVEMLYVGGPYLVDYIQKPTDTETHTTLSIVVTLTPKFIYQNITTNLIKKNKIYLKSKINFYMLLYFHTFLTFTNYALNYCRPTVPVHSQQNHTTQGILRIYRQFR